VRPHSTNGVISLKYHRAEPPIERMLAGCQTAYARADDAHQPLTVHFSELYFRVLGGMEERVYYINLGFDSLDELDFF
jgi:hypothetical protein